MAKKVIQVIDSRENVDTDTGEITRVESKKVVTIKLGRQDEFYSVYWRYMAPVYSLKYADDIKVLIKLCELSEYETGTVSLTPPKRSRICKELGMHSSNVSKSLKRLKEKDLISGGNGEFQINPVIFWKGDRSKRADLLRNRGLSVTFNFTLDDEKVARKGE